MQEAVVLGDGTQNGVKATVFNGGFLRVTDEPHAVLVEVFDAAIDTTNVWAAANAGGGVAQAVASGALTIGTGTTTAGYSKVASIPTFKPAIPAWLGVSFAISLADAAAPTAQTYRFWGVGTTPGSPTAAAPLTDAVGFELTTAGHLVAVVYAAGSRTAVQDLNASGGNSTQPTTTASHRYGVYVRTDRAYWFIDTLDNIVATSSFQSPAIQTLPVLMLAVAGTTPGSSGVISCTGLAVWDTGKNAHQMNDGTYPWRKATVDASGNQIVKAAQQASSATLATVAISTTSASILAASATRLGATVTNESTAVLYLALTSSAATVTAYTVQIPAGGYYEVPATYAGAITGILPTGATSGSARVTSW